MSLKTNVSRERIYELFTVDLEEGRLYRKNAVGMCREGKHAGYSNRMGYRIICIDRVDYFEHNLIWFLSTGKWPPKGFEIDHINCVRCDNRPLNLRLATRSQNNINSGPTRKSQTGRRGVYLNSRGTKYYAQVTKNGKCHSVGTFDTVEDADKAVAAMRQKLFGEFARP